MRTTVPLQKLQCLILHGRILVALRFAQAFGVIAVDELTEETFLHIEPQMIGIIDGRTEFEETLYLVHHFNGIGFQIFAIDNVQLLRCIIG